MLTSLSQAHSFGNDLTLELYPTHIFRERVSSFSTERKLVCLCGGGCMLLVVLAAKEGSLVQKKLHNPSLGDQDGSSAHYMPHSHREGYGC